MTPNLSRLFAEEYFFDPRRAPIRLVVGGGRGTISGFYKLISSDALVIRDMKSIPTDNIGTKKFVILNATCLKD
jgi:hypothetical protein